MIDVSDEVHAQEALRASEQLLRRLTEAMSVGVFHLDADRHLLLANPSLHAILGTRPGDDLEALTSLVVDPGAVDRALEAVLGGSDLDIELDARRVDGDEIRHLMVSARALSDEDGAVTAAVGCVTDVTDVTESVRLRDELARRATIDDLTGCANRPTVLEALEDALARAVGVAWSAAGEHVDADTLVARADADMYARKSGGCARSGLGQEPSRVAPVHVAHERREDVVAEQLLEALGQGGHHVGPDADEVGLLGPQPRRRVLEDHAEAGPVGAVGAAAVHDVPGVEGHAPGRHLGVHHRLVLGRVAPRLPPVAALDEPGGAVGLGEVVEGPHRVDHHLTVRLGQRVDAVVPVQDLRRLARPDLDARGCRQLVVAEQGVEHAQQHRVDGQVVEGPGLAEQVVDALRAVALEVVAARGRGVEHPGEVVADRGDAAAVEHALADHHAVLPDPRRDGVGFEGNRADAHHPRPYPHTTGNVRSQLLQSSAMGSWNFADIWETVADELPDAPCLIHGDGHRTWAEVDRRADGIAQHLLDAGLERQQAFAQYLYNGNEYMESMYAAFKAALVPVNTNYRYTSDELLYLWDNADAGAVAFHGCFVDTIDSIREKLPKVRAWLWVDDGSGACPDWATPYESVATSGAGRVSPAWGRSGDDLNMLYTGGTTGMPKGVMWRQDDLAVKLSATLANPLPEDGTVDDIKGSFTAPGARFLPACPQMHGTGNFPCLSTLSAGGSIVTLTNRTFDPVELLETIEREGVNLVALVGDAFGKPILRALDGNEGRWDLSSLVGMVSSGVMWSKETKEGLLRHHGAMVLMDAFSSSEALGMGSSISGGGQAAETAKFELSPETIVIDDDDRPIEPGSDKIGRLAVGGRQPVGYYKDPEKTAKTFLEIDGQRYSCPGDFATVDADGKITLLGRGSVCINTGGEKVFPEEVEEALKTHPTVLDAVAVGIPDEKFGEAVTAVVEPRPGEQVDEGALIAHVKTKLAAYKAPKRVVVVDTIGRAANGKVDYKRLKGEAQEHLGVS